MHHDAPAESESLRFMDLTLGADALETPDGPMPLKDIERSAFHRDFESAGPGPKETSTAAVVGGAVVGAAVFGAPGAVVGGLAGSTVKQDGPEQLRESSARLIFETPDARYELPVAPAEEGAAIEFADAVERAAKKAR
jgi:hypothetical protein